MHPVWVPTRAEQGPHLVLRHLGASQTELLGASAGPHARRVAASHVVLSQRLASWPALVSRRHLSGQVRVAVSRRQLVHGHHGHHRRNEPPVTCGVSCTPRAPSTGNSGPLAGASGNPRSIDSMARE
uniref:Uncharacterized protein n=1 Tax=Paenarthrobacter aurescens TaxID=43663 RepID=Q6SJY9_PAEAU|nr:hypothetical protein [Paenarthrobacter aurescens]